MSDWANEEQRDWMRTLADIPRRDRCKSGWHIIPGSPSAAKNSAEACDCGPPPPEEVVVLPAADTPEELVP